LRILGMICAALSMGCFVWALVASSGFQAKSPLAGYSRWQNFIYVRRRRSAGPMVAGFSLLTATLGLGALRRGHLDFMTGLAIGAMAASLVLWALVLTWPLPPPP